MGTYQALSPFLQENLACPICKGSPLHYNNEHLLCTVCNRQFPIKDGICYLLPDYSRETFYSPADQTILDQHLKSLSKLTTETNEAIGAEYDRRWMKPETPYEFFERATAFEELGLRGGEVVLDIGAGTLRNGLYALEKGAGMVCGVDLIPGMLKAGKNKAEEKGFGNRVNLVVGDARFMPFREQAFDAAISLAVLEHIPLNVEKVFDEILRVLKPGGKAIVNTWSLATCLRNRRKKNAGYFCNDNFYKYYSTRELRSLVQARGFVRHKVYGHRFALMSGILRRLRVPAWRELSLGIERNTRRYVPALSTLLGQCLMVRLEK